VKKIVLAVLLVFIVACAPIATPAPTATLEPTPTPAPTATLVPPTPTPKVSEADKAKFAAVVKAAFDVEDNNLSVDDVTWEGDVIKLKCTLQHWIDEPTDHSDLHWALLRVLVTSVFPASIDFEGVSVEIISVGKLTKTEMLSSTKWDTIKKIMDGKITTEIEWKREAEIVL